MNKFEYYKYLQSEDWKERKKELLEEANYTCDECGKKAIILHHLKYDLLGYEMLNVDVVAVCKECHEMLHSYEGDDYGEYHSSNYGYGEW